MATISKSANATATGTKAGHQHTRETLPGPPEVAAYLGTSVAQLANMRYRGTGPKFCMLGRSIRYRWADVDAWLEENTRTQTGE